MPALVRASAEPVHREVARLRENERPAAEPGKARKVIRKVTEVQGRLLGAAGATRPRQRPEDRSGEDDPPASSEFAPLVGVRAGVGGAGRGCRRAGIASPPHSYRRSAAGVSAARRQALSEVKRTQLHRLLNSPEHADEAAAGVYAKLLDAGVYPGLVSTLYRVLRDHDEIRERRGQATHLTAKKAGASGHQAG